ncbi:MAG: methionine--tRNA ligase subunit beta [Candidatus Margulisiibacteriota bacterium]
MPSIEDFMKFEFKIAKIIDAQDHPNADKLLVLKIDVGEMGIVGGGSRPARTEEAPHAAPVQDPISPSPKYKQIVAGIKKSYSKEDLIGKYIVVVNNLEPAVLRGVESNGMLLAATGADGMPILISPERPVEPGSKVK